MLDTATLRVAFGVVGLCVLVLFYGVTYRTTRSAYSAWWCVSLGMFLASALLFLGNGTRIQAVANPMGNTLAVAGGAGVWAAARSLHERDLPLWQLILLPGVVMVASFADDPAHDVWSGGAVFLAGMAATLGLSARELALILRSRGSDTRAQPQYRFAVASLMIASGAVSLFYLARAGVFVAVGPEDPVFRVGFGSQATTLTTMALLVLVTFSMSALSHEQQTRDLRDLAEHDGLTGVLNRTEFVRRVTASLSGALPGRATVVLVADLDGFKALNDGHGHAAGDDALVAFAACCLDVVGAHGVVGRLGGDEFALAIGDGLHPEQVAEAVRRRFRTDPSGRPRPTVSFGVARIEPAVGVKDTIVRADVALYQAKAAGRDRVVRYQGLSL